MYFFLYLFACVVICAPAQFLNNSYVLHKSEYFLSANCEESNKSKSWKVRIVLQVAEMNKLTAHF